MTDYNSGSVHCTAFTTQTNKD